MKHLSLTLFLMLAVIGLRAQAICGGTIGYEFLGGLTYQFEISVWVCEQADSLQLDIDFGDGTMTTETVPLDSISTDVYRANISTLHTYPSASTYVTSVEKSHLLGGICNIPNSIAIPFYLETTLTMSPFFGANSTPVLLSSEWEVFYDAGWVLHSLTPYDADGDSLSFELIPYNVAGSSIPDNLEITSDGVIRYLPELVCDVMVIVKINEWRSGAIMSYFMRSLVLHGTTVSISDLDRTHSTFLAYPNPADNFLNLDLSGFREGRVTLSVTDLLGRVITEFELRMLNFELNVSDWPDGIYLLSIGTKDGRIATGRVVVQHE